MSEINWCACSALREWSQPFAAGCAKDRLLIDEVGHIQFDQYAANLFFLLIASRYEQGSVMVTSHLPFGRWGETFSDDVMAAASIECLVHRAEVLTLTGDSYRTRRRRELPSEENRAGRR
jgi:DNA replication protein DnaC